VPKLKKAIYRNILSKLKFIISGGGTGGHIFPAIAIAGALKAVCPDADFLFVGAKGRMEMEKVPAAGYPIVGLGISGFQRKLCWSNVLFPFKVIFSLLKARKIVQSFQPDAAIGTGGYASGPLLEMATRKGVPTLIQEQNSFPGITNKILGKKVNKICVAYEGMDRYFPQEKIILTGNPVRKDISFSNVNRMDAVHFFGLEPGKKILLVIGGSLGARTINESIEMHLDEMVSKEVQLIWQTGKSYFTTAQKSAEKFASVGVKVFEFISRMDHAYAAADIVVSRAGAISLSELAIAGKASILVPSPNVAEDHQTKNALALIKNEAAVMVSDKDSRGQLWNEIKLLMSDDSKQKKLASNIKKSAFPDAAEKIALQILEMIKTRK